MRKTLVIAVAAAALIGATALPASAAPPYDTVTTFTLDAGLLTYSVDQAADLGDGTEYSGETSIYGNLGVSSVTDARGGILTWNASATSTTFVGALASAPSQSSAVSYEAGEVTETGTITVADGSATTLTGSSASIVSPTLVSGNNTASWDPELTVTMPATAKADTYTGTVTTSVS